MISVTVFTMNITPEQVQIIKTTWATAIATPMDTGEAVLIAFFTKFPQHKDHFKAFKNIPNEQLKVKNERNYQNDIPIHCAKSI